MAKVLFNKFTIWKNEDIRKYLTKDQISQLLICQSAIASGRIKDGKPAGNCYYVVNTDEPYAEEVLQLILQGEEKKEFCGDCKAGKCSTRDYGPNQYEKPCYECCLGCGGAINMECTFVCSKVAEHYHPSEENEIYSNDLEKLVLVKYPNAEYAIAALCNFGEMKKVCYVANHDGDGVVNSFDVAYISKDKKVWSWRTQCNP